MFRESPLMFELAQRTLLEFDPTANKIITTRSRCAIVIRMDNVGNQNDPLAVLRLDVSEIHCFVSILYQND